MVICLHFNAEGWGDPGKPELVEQNHLHFLITGALSPQEISYEDQRFDMLVKLLNRSFLEEVALANVMSRRMSAPTGLPPYLPIARARPYGSTRIRMSGHVIFSPIGCLPARWSISNLT